MTASAPTDDREHDFTGMGNTLAEALLALSDMIAATVPGGVPVGVVVPHESRGLPPIEMHALHAWQEGGRWHVRVRMRAL